MRSKKEASLVAAGITAATYFALNAFSSGVRKEIEKRDRECQIEGGNKDSHTETHHIAPECLENGNETSTADPYSQPLLDEYNRLLRMIEPEHLTEFRRKVKYRIRGPSNGILINSRAHREIHSGKVNKIIRLKENPEHPERPRDLSIGTLKTYLRTEIFRKTREEMGLED